MERISTSQLRREGFTAFEAEIINYALANDLQAGARFKGVPGHPRYGTSNEEEEILESNGTTLRILRGNGKELHVNISGFKPLGTRASSAPSNDNNNTTNNTTTTMNTSNITEVFAAMMQQQIKESINKGKEEAAGEIAALKAKIEELKSKGTGSIINVTIDGQKTTTHTEEILDPSFENILKLVAAGENVYLYGPAGSGKNTICAQIAKALGLKFYYQNTMLSKFDISGYNNAQGKFEDTPAFHAMTEGGLLMLDELDNSQAEAIVAINAALANGYYTFPNIGNVKLHENFRCIAAGNTNGQGATEEYCGRYQMDESSRDRFAFIKIDYNEAIEKSIAGGKSDILAFVHALRNAAAQKQIKLICGYRAISKLAKFYDMDTRFVLDAYIFKGMNIDDIKELASAISLTGNKYTEELKKY